MIIMTSEAMILSRFLFQVRARYEDEAGDEAKAMVEALDSNPSSIR